MARNSAPAEAVLLPLDGKYYGTRIAYRDGEFKIWGVKRTHQLSERELADKPADAEDDWESEIMCGGHYEDQGDYEVAKAIVDFLNQKQP